jgi:hypothetical protein
MSLRVILAALALSACSPAVPTSSPTSTRPMPTSRMEATEMTSAVGTAASGTAGLAATDRLERRHRLAEALPHATAHYRIDFAVAADGRLAVRVTLLAVLNQPRDLAAYQAELRRYRAEALAFIEAQGDDPATYTVTVLPDPTATSPKEGP